MKKIFLIFLTLVILVSAGIVYLNKVFLPLKIKSLIITALEQQIHLPVKLESLEFNIFKGLILRNLSIGTLSDGARPILSLQECSCSFLPLPFFKKQIIIPAVKVKSAVIFLERRADKTLNVSDLFGFLEKSNKSVPRKTSLTEKSKFSVFVYKVTVLNSRIDFEDRSLSPQFAETVGNLNLRLNLCLPASVKFNLKAEIQTAPPVKIVAEGEYKIPQQQLVSKINVKDFSPQEFLVYYQNFGVSRCGGRIDTDAEINFKDEVIDTDINLQAKNIEFVKEKVCFKLDSNIKTHLKYNLAAFKQQTEDKAPRREGQNVSLSAREPIGDKPAAFSGKADILNLDISGLEFVEKIQNIHGEVKFDNSGLSSDKLNAGIFGLPMQAKLRLTDFTNPLLDVNLMAKPSLQVILGLLKDKFKIVLPVDIEGQSCLSLNLQSQLISSQPPEINGYLDVLGAAVKIKNLDTPIESVNGRLGFSQSQISWQELNFKYSGIDYKTKGVLADFNAPRVELELSSQDGSLRSEFTVNDKVINFSEMNGKYLNSDFLLSGSIDAADLPQVKTNISGQLNIDLGSLKDYLKKFKNQLDIIKPLGRVQVKFNLDGNIQDVKSCVLAAKITGRDLSFYGLKSEEFSLEYNQGDNLIDIPLVRLSLYDGIVNLSAKMNLAANDPPFWINADIKDVKLEKLKLDTPAKKEDISGIIQAEIKLNGYLSGVSKLNGAGEILISEGKLWQLDLFKGLGRVLFTQDFTNIVFSQGYCGFSVSDKLISSDNLKLKSNLANISGSLKIGFDSSIEAMLNVEVLDEAPLTGTFKDVTTAILGQAGKFGVIKISGTLREPKYKFKPAVVDIIKGLTDTFLKR